MTNLAARLVIDSVVRSCGRLGEETVAELASDEATLAVV